MISVTGEGCKAAYAWSKHMLPFCLPSVCTPGRRAVEQFAAACSGCETIKMMCRGHGPNVNLKRHFLTGVFL